MEGTNLDIYELEREELLKKVGVRNAQLNVLRDQLSRAERVISEYKTKALRKATGVHIYSAGDYWGLSAGGVQFYYGHEATMCLKHDDCTCEDKEWCFTASENDVEVMRIPESRLGQSSGIMNLLHGIGQYLGRKTDTTAASEPGVSYCSSANRS